MAALMIAAGPIFGIINQVRPRAATVPCAASLVGASSCLAHCQLCAPPASQVFGRASKYSLFDPCKEMLYITMTDKRVRAPGPLCRM